MNEVWAIVMIVLGVFCLLAVLSFIGTGNGDGPSVESMFASQKSAALTALVCVCVSGCGSIQTPAGEALRALKPEVTFRCTAVVEAAGMPIVAVSGTCAAGLDEQVCWAEKSGLIIAKPRAPDDPGGEKGGK